MDEESEDFAAAVAEETAFNAEQAPDLSGMGLNTDMR